MRETVLDLVAGLLVLLALPGTIELALLTLGGILPARRMRPGPVGRTLRMAAVVPARDVQDSIAACVASLIASDPHLEVFVVADNCEDETASLAATAGARVLVRSDEERLGKGHALDFAFRTLMGEGWEAFVVVDADSRVDVDFVAVCRRLFAAGADAIQTRCCVLNPADSLRTRLMNVAFFALNVLRPRGRERFQLSAGIAGNGFGVTAETLRAVPYDAMSVVGDVEYHLRLVRAGRRVEFADAAHVLAEMPADSRGVRAQRARWEGGRLRMRREMIPVLLREVGRGEWRLLEPVLDLLLLPLTFHVFGLGLAILLAESSAIQMAAVASLGVVLLHVVAALIVGRARLADWEALLLAPFYVLWKLAMAPAIWSAARPRTPWVETQRQRDRRA